MDLFIPRRKGASAALEAPRGKRPLLAHRLCQPSCRSFFSYAMISERVSLSESLSGWACLGWTSRAILWLARARSAFEPDDGVLETCQCAMKNINMSDPTAMRSHRNYDTLPDSVPFKRGSLDRPPSTVPLGMKSETAGCTAAGETRQERCAWKHCASLQRIEPRAQARSNARST
jgi:hypothetical protein